MTYGDYKAFLEGAKLYKKPFDVSGIGRVYEYKDTAFATFNELKGRKDLGVVDKIYFATDSCEPDAYLGMFTNVKDLRIFRAPQCKNIPWASGLSKAEIVKLSETEVEDVSWLRNMRELKWLEISDSPVRDMSMLRDHTDIHTLELCNTKVSDISFIEHYPNLMYLQLINCPIEDFSPLYRLKSYLKYLEIDESAAREIDLDKLRERHIGIDIKTYNDTNPIECLF